jgi:hypothetical protein
MGTQPTITDHSTIQTSSSTKSNKSISNPSTLASYPTAYPVNDLLNVNATPYNERPPMQLGENINPIEYKNDELKPIGIIYLHKVGNVYKFENPNFDPTKKMQKEQVKC